MLEQVMAEPRKIFRIEETAAAYLTRGAARAPALSPRGSGARLDEEAVDVTRVARELDAVVSGTHEATQKILAAAEAIDQAANTLSAALKGRIEQGLAEDILDHVIRIFEACNFQDLIGQRTGKVMAALNAARLKTAPKAARQQATQYLHGPRLDTDRGHATQADVDAIFGD
jgi:chemotaxis protein CheZ